MLIRALVRASPACMWRLLIGRQNALVDRSDDGSKSVSHWCHYWNDPWLYYWWTKVSTLAELGSIHKWMPKIHFWVVNCVDPHLLWTLCAVSLAWVWNRVHASLRFLLYYCLLLSGELHRKWEQLFHCQHYTTVFIEQMKATSVVHVSQTDRRTIIECPASDKQLRNKNIGPMLVSLETFIS